MSFMNIWKTTYLSLYNTAQAFLAHTEEDMTASSGPARINRNANRTISGVFETSGHRQR
jgi:hypothetical protein